MYLLRISLLYDKCSVNLVAKIVMYEKEFLSLIFTNILFDYYK